MDEPQRVSIDHKILLERIGQKDIENMILSRRIAELENMLKEERAGTKSIKKTELTEKE